ncbi:MAG: hypothetical protein KC766_35115, partial [Myxococcales bacterium]|nr:hypothetical protein [Myxococcales bacterium]
MMATSLLLRDAQAALRLTAEAGRLSVLEASFVAWLRDQLPPPEVPLALAPPLRRYEHVALACLAEAAGWCDDTGLVEEGLRWLVDVSLERAGMPAPVVTDALAQTVIGLAARGHSWIAAWHDDLVSRGDATPVWLVGGGAYARGATTDGSVELRHALASRGVGTTGDADALVLLERLKAGDLPEDAFHAQVLLVALEWARRSAPVAVPGQATPETVARLLARV